MAIRVFIADDHKVVRDGLRALLESQVGVTVVGEAADGRSAVRQVQQILPDVVVMDIAMPELNGLEATRQVRESCPATQVVILSMYATTEHIYRALQAGALGYLAKETAGREVREAVFAVHAGRRYLSEQINEAIVNSFVLRGREAETMSPLERLSAREREVLQLVVEGRSSAEIAGLLHLSLKSVETYRSRLMRKLGVSNLVSLVRFAIQHGITPLT